MGGRDSFCISFCDVFSFMMYSVRYLIGPTVDFGSMVYYVEHVMLLLTISNNDGYGIILCLFEMIVLYDALFILSHRIYKIMTLVLHIMTRSWLLVFFPKWFTFVIV